MIIVAFMRPRAHSGIARCPAIQSSVDDKVQPTPASAATTRNIFVQRTVAIKRQTTINEAFAYVVNRCGENRERALGMMKMEVTTEPMAMLVNKKPRLAASRCNSCKPTTGINAEMIEMKNAKVALRSTMIFIPGVYRT